MSDNAQQIEFWNGPAGERWASLAETTERSMTFVTAALLPFAAAKQGERILDTGCGCGATTLALSQAAGTGGSVTGLDISQPMLAVARKRAKDAGANITFIEADASVHKFKPEFDLIFSRFGVMFFSDPVAAFSNLHTALAPGGRLAFVCWRLLADNAWALAPLAAAQDLLPPQEPVDPHAPGPFALADDSRTVAILKKAGFSDPHTSKLDTVMNMGASLDDAVSASLNIGPLSRAASQVDEATRSQIRDRVRGVLSKFQTPAGITPPAACWLVSAKA